MCFSFSQVNKQAAVQKGLLPPKKKSHILCGSRHGSETAQETRMRKESATTSPRTGGFVAQQRKPQTLCTEKFKQKLQQQPTRKHGIWAKKRVKSLPSVSRFWFSFGFHTHPLTCVRFSDYRRQLATWRQRQIFRLELQEVKSLLHRDHTLGKIMVHAKFALQATRAIVQKPPQLYQSTKIVKSACKLLDALICSNFVICVQENSKSVLSHAVAKRDFSFSVICRPWSQGKRQFGIECVVHCTMCPRMWS